MKLYARTILLSALTAVVSGGAFAAGESAENPVVWNGTSSTAVSLGAAGECWVKFPVPIGEDLTVYTTGYSTGSELGDMSVGMDVLSAAETLGSVDIRDEKGFPVALEYPSFWLNSDSDGMNMRAYLYGEEWSLWSTQVEFVPAEERSKLVDREVTRDGKNGIYYIRLSGVPGKSVTLNIRSGVVTPSSGPTTKAEGSAEKPSALTITDTEQKISKTYVSGSYCFEAKLNVGEVYLIGTWGALGPGDQSITFYESAKLKIEDYNDWCTGNDVGYLVEPKVSGSYVFCVYTKDGMSTSCTLRCMKFGGRPIGKHDFGVMDAPGGNVGDSVTTNCTPGLRVEKGSRYTDTIIDEVLLQVRLTGGTCYRVTTAGATKPIVMELYSSGGQTLCSNRRGFTSGLNCLLACLPEEDDDYYIGVCRDVPKGTTDITDPEQITVKVEVVEPTAPDAWDSADDTLETLTEASLIEPKIADSSSADPVAVGAEHGPHKFGVSDYVDMFAFDGYRNVGYKLRASCPDNAYGQLWSPSGVVFTVKTDAKGSETRQNVASGDLLDGFAFVPTANDTFYVEVTVPGGCGIDYPYSLHALAYDPAGAGLGRLTVNINGPATATWSLLEDGKNPPAYPSGESILVPAGERTVTFSKVTGLNKPADATVTVAKGGTCTVEAKDACYNDTFDNREDDAAKGDGSAARAVSLTPQTLAAGRKAPVASRTLWTWDEADWFKFSAAPNTFYSFALVESEKLGDAVIEIVASDKATVLDNGRDIVFISKKTTTETCYVRVVHSTGAKADSAYDLAYYKWAVKARAASAHETVAAETGTFAKPDAAGGSALFKPGYRNSRERKYRDDIVDESLFKVTLEKGETYLFETEGADAALVMELYNSSGQLLASNGVGKGNGKDCVIAWQATTTGDHYVGVCQDLADDDRDEATAGPCTFRVTKIQMAPSAPEALMPVIGQPGDDPVEKGAASRAKLLSPSNWVDTFTLAGRKGVTYRLRAATDDPACSDLWNLRVEIYQLTTAGKRPSKPTQVIGDLVLGGEIVATANANYEIDVRVVEKGTDGSCPGVTYPYVLHSLACGDGGLGIVTFGIGGATAAEGASLTLVEDGKNAPKYVDGDSVILQAGQPWTAKYATVKNWTVPANEVFEASTETNVTVSVKYSDDHDVPGDDAAKGDGSMTGKKVTKLTVSAVAKGKTAPVVRRSLWADDVADWFSFTPTVNAYHAFALVGDDERLGDASLEVFEVVAGAAKGQPSVTNTLACGRAVKFLYRASKASPCYVRVSHVGGTCVDSEYGLTYFLTKPGVLGFAKAAYSVKDNVSTATVTVPVNRTGGSEGIVRARYATRAGTAKPGRDYEPVTGELVWSNGVTKAQNVVVKIIPDLVDAWSGERTFAIDLMAVTEGLAADEQIPSFGITRTQVTISDSAKKATGTVQFCGEGPACEELPKSKKSSEAGAVDIGAGESLRLWLERVGGSDGRIAVTVTPTKGTALAGTDFDATPVTLVWDDGDVERKCFRLRTLRASDDYSATKSLTVKLTADKTYGDVAKSLGKPIAVNLGDPQVTRTMADYSASFAKGDGITVKASKDDAWYFDRSGSLRSAPLAAGGTAKLTVTLDGPGRLAFTPFFEAVGDIGSGSFACQIGQRKLSTADGTLVSGTEIVRYLPKGKTTVTFTLTKDRNRNLDGDVAAVFADQGVCKAFDWKPLPLPTLVSPLANEISVAQECVEGHGKEVFFRWACSDDPRISYCFSLDDVKTRVGTANAWITTNLTACSHSLEVICGDCGLEEEGKIMSGKTYYWRVNAVMSDEAGVPVLTNANTEVWTMHAIMCEDDGALPRTAVVGGFDADGNALAGIEQTPVDGGYPVKLVQGVKADIALAAQNVSGNVVFEEKTKNLSKFGLSISDGHVVGMPTKAGECIAVIGMRGVTGSTVTFKFVIEPLDLAAGTFNGLLATDALCVTGSAVSAAQAIGSLKVTATAAGSLSATVKVGDKSYTFSGKKGYDKAVPCLDNGVPGVMVTLSNLVSLTTKDGTKKTTWKNQPNTLTLVAARTSADGWTALDTPMSAEMSLCLLSEDSSSILSNVVWKGEACRDNSALAQAVEKADEFVGYYTVSLNPLSEETGVEGYGYLTLKIAAKNKVTVTGKLADGSSVSASSVSAYRSEGAGKDGTPELVIPVFAWLSSPKASFGGWLTLKMNANGEPYAVSADALRWICVNPLATYSGDRGFVLDLEPVGGYYNTVYNLQRYYLEEQFLIDGIDIEAIPAEFFGGKDPVVYPGSSGAIALDWAMNKLSIAKDPSGMTLSFVRTTGIFTGKFDIGTTNVNSKGTVTTSRIGSCSHFGVLPIVRDEEASIQPAQAVMMGAYQAEMKLPTPGKSTKRSWKASLPLVIRAEKRPEGWDQENW